MVTKTAGARDLYRSVPLGKTL